MNTFAPEFSALIDHLGLGRTGDLDAPVVEVRGRVAPPAMRFAHGRRLGQEVEPVLTCSHALRRVAPRGERSPGAAARTRAPAAPENRAHRASGHVEPSTALATAGWPRSRRSAWAADRSASRPRVLIDQQLAGAVAESLRAWRSTTHHVICRRYPGGCRFQKSQDGAVGAKIALHFGRELGTTRVVSVHAGPVRVTCLERGHARRRHPAGRDQRLHARAR